MQVVPTMYDGGGRSLTLQRAIVDQESLLCYSVYTRVRKVPRMTQSITSQSSHDSAKPPGVAIYVCVVGAAAAVTIFDGVQNEKAAALMKTGGWFSRVFAGGDQGAIWFVLALLFFCVFAGLIAFAYRPREAKEAFLLGASVLALLNALVKSPLDTSRSASVNFLISSAHAQEEGKTVEPAKASVWLVLDGPKQYTNPETKLFVFDAKTGKTVLNSNIRTTSKVELPQGDYYFELAHDGYRGVVFKADISGASTAFRPKLRQVQFDSFANLFGPEQVQVKADEGFALSVGKAMSLCGTGDSSAAKHELTFVGEKDLKKLTADPLLSGALCVRPATDQGSFK